MATRNLAELPIITRTPILLATLSPGVTPTNPRYDLTPFSNSGLTTWSINGSTSLSTEFLLDGAPNSAVYESKPSVAYIPPVDAVQELKVTAGAYDAQYGHNGGGVINMVDQKRNEPASRVRLRLPEAAVAECECILE